MADNKPQPGKQQSWKDVLKSVAASAFGVQSYRNYQQDFAQTSVAPFVIVGVLFVIVLVVGLTLLVSLIV
ncbi:DUF2970 domain-containing protein [Aestuariibacter salexigens]|uniref:DUF2970 domain-containing protein n=1 Tax=Aestuariibacter salexigens TaxID=226010 RepID=UPI00041850E0|nr:DUF2970 domain-containing protein [Aestuariibacter salexigens]